MTAMSSERRFCSCSDVPPRLKDGSLGDTPETPPETHESGSSDEARFYTCSEEPAGSSEQPFDQSAVVDDADGPENTACEVDERPAVSKVVPETSSNSETDVDSAGAGPPELRSVSDLFPGETTVDSVSTHGKGGSEVVLTNRRVLLRGAPEAKVLHASMPLSEIGSLAISRARPSKRSLVWGLIGIGAAIGMWQALDGVGNMRLIIGAVVMLMSGLLLADYFLRPPDLQVVFRSHSGFEMTVEFGQSHADEADRFAAQVLAKLEDSPTH